jgi:recyclin-1
MKSSDGARFLSSSNPAQVKRNVLASFTDVLLLPVTIVPRAVGGALMTGSTAAVQGIAMLNPQRWGSNNSSGATNGYMKHLDSDNDTLFETGPEDDADDLQSPLEGLCSVICHVRCFS